MEDLEERAEMYGIPTEKLMNVMLEVLNGRALMWYRNNRRPKVTWDAFKEDFFKFFLLSPLHRKLRGRNSTAATKAEGTLQGLYAQLAGFDAS